MSPGIIRRAMSQLSAVHRGTAFEERSLQILQDHFSMSLRRVGGKSDGGIDLQGWWWLPPLSHTRASAATEASPNRRRLRILAQCKAEKKKFSPNYVREMEGVWHCQNPTREENTNSSYPSVALLLSESPFTTSTLKRALSSSVPFLLLHLPPASVDGDSAANDPIGSAFCNPALGGQSGLLEGEVEIRWEHALSGGRPGLWWHGQRLESWTPDRQPAEPT
ncbi:hypothetical protein BV22DRAFT_1090396 [Leucogyrophana mollusca]|uniref:Uncharacterized protein n=1 Tax=Leucogyrophana mollusca TaxID=85980 RepID=A0ACB8BFQ6_9AGAM|nr:hypothetical protein BV22DRAFT_1090396 [Leucogyrophana mollusca]